MCSFPVGTLKCCIVIIFINDLIVEKGHAPSIIHYSSILYRKSMKFGIQEEFLDTKAHELTVQNGGMKNN